MRSALCGGAERQRSTMGACAHAPLAPQDATTALMPPCWLLAARRQRYAGAQSDSARPRQTQHSFKPDPPLDVFERGREGPTTCSSEQLCMPQVQPCGRPVGRACQRRRSQWRAQVAQRASGRGVPARQPDELRVPGYPGVRRSQVAAVDVKDGLVLRPVGCARHQALLRRRAILPRACARPP